MNIVTFLLPAIFLLNACSAYNDASSQSASIAEPTVESAVVAEDSSAKACSKYFLSTMDGMDRVEAELHQMTGDRAENRAYRAKRCRECALKVSGLHKGNEPSNDQRKTFNKQLLSCHERFSTMPKPRSKFRVPDLYFP